MVFVYKSIFHAPFNYFTYLMHFFDRNDTFQPNNFRR